MKYKKEINNNDLKRLIVITNCIYNVYMNNQLDDDTKAQYLKLTIEEENSIYDKLEVTKKNLEDIIDKYKLLLSISDYSDDVKEKLADRTINYLLFLAYKYPFKSTSKHYFIAEEEDINTITTQAEIDYSKLLIKLTKNTINTTKSKIKRKKSIQRLNEIKFTNKEIEVIDDDNISINGRNTCLLFGHNQELIDSVYEDVCLKNFDESINVCLNFSDECLKRNSSKIELGFTIDCIKASLYMLNTNEISFIIKKFYDRILNNNSLNAIKEKSSISLNMIVNSIETIAREKNIAEKNAKKVKNNK